MTTGFNGWRPPGQKDIDSGNEYDKAVTSFMKNTALRFLQLVYMEREKGCLRYVEGDEEATEIKIADQHAFQLEASESKPAIIAVRGGLGWQGVGMNEGMQEMDRITGSRTSTDLINGTVGFSCLSRVGLEAEQIASDVFHLFKFFRPTLRKLGFFTIKSMNIGPEQMVDVQGEPKLFLVSVLMQCQVQDRWILEPKSAAELKRVVVQGLTSVKGQPIDEDEDPFFELDITSENNGGM